jgi:hypothetical protein
MWMTCAAGLLCVACESDQECHLGIVSPAPDLQFDTNPFSDLNRPDSAIVVGPAHVVTAVNFQMQVRDLDGSNPTTFDLNSFFDEDPTHSVGDPRLIYDAVNDRFILSALGFNYFDSTKEGDTFDSWCDVAVSATGDPRGAWHKYSFQVLRGTEQMDFDSLGHDDEAIYVTARMRDLLDKLEFTGNRVLILDKAIALEGGEVTPVIVEDVLLPDGAGPAEIIKPVELLDAAALEGPTFFLTESGDESGFKLVLYTITDPLGTPTFTPTTIPIAPWAAASSAPQKGGSPVLTLGAGDVLQKTSMRNGVVWTAHSHLVAGRAGVVVYKIDPFLGVLIEQYTISHPEISFYLPAVVPDGFGNAAVVFAASDANHFASIFYSRYFAASNAFEFPAVVTAGTATFAPNTESSASWGDYLDAAPDIGSGNLVWVHGELPTPCDCPTTTTWTMRAARIPTTTPPSALTCNAVL